MAALFNASTSDSFTTARNEFSSSNQSLPHPLSHFVQTRSASTSPSNSLGYVNRFQQQRGQRSSPNYHQHQPTTSRQSNPFGAIYGGGRGGHTTIHETTRSSSEDIFGEPTMQHSSYFEIERNFNKGKIIPPDPNRRHTPPIVTIVDDSSLKRTGSIVSRSATLRNRNKIKSRNTTVQAKDLESEDDATTSHKRKKRDRLMFRFPVKRKTSLKYSKVPQHPKVSTPDFSSNEQLQKFLKSCNAEDLVRELLPKRMQLFKYNQVVSIHPRLHSVHEIFDISKENEFELLKIHPKLISSPIHKHTQPSHSRHYSNIQFKEIVYQKYKAAVFANKLRRVPKFEEMYPDDLQLLKKQEIDHINQKLLFEILLRRTVAAKIEYRLHQGGFDNLIDDETTSSRYSSTNSSSNSRNGNGNTGTRQNHQGDPGLEEDKDSSNGSRESINTDELMQQNASLFSELLPSPQISYTSDIFGSINFDTPQSGYNSSKSNSQDHKSIKTTTSTLDPYKIHPSQSPKYKQESQESLYINNFNKSYQQKYNSIDDVESALFNSKVYQLKPINRSVTTLSSSDSFPNINRSSPTSQAFKPDIQNRPTDTSTKSSSSTKEPHTTTSSGKRKSNSTTNTSVFQNLEDLSSELSSFMNDDNNKKQSLPPNTSAILPTIITTLPQSPVNLQLFRPNNQTMKINPGPTISSSKNAMQNTMSLYDIKSMKGSISVVTTSEYAQSNAPSMSPTSKAEVELNTINEGLQAPSSSINTRSLSPNKLHTRHTNLVIRRNDSNSTRSMISSHKKDLSYSDSTDGSTTR